MAPAGSPARKSSASDSRKPPLSCAECRRLKLKCDRTWPCSSCRKRGLAHLCPDGSLATRPRQKPPPPAPQHVLQRIYELQTRINQLETALAALQSTVSSEPHPLLKSDSQPYLQKKLMRKAALEKAQEEGFDLYPKEESSSGKGEESYGQEDIIDVLGTLSIAPDGRSRFFGPTAVSEGLSIEQEHVVSTSGQAILPSDIVALAQSFPFATASEAVNALHEGIKSYLPQIERAETLCVSYFTHADFVQNTLPQDEWFEDLFWRLYAVRRSSSRSPESREQSGAKSPWRFVPADELSVFFSMLAIGALTDISSEPFSAEAEMYYQLSRALLTTEHVLTEPTIASVQTLFLGSYYEGLQSQSNSSRNCWIMMVLAGKTAQVMGLHRDHSMFGLDKQEIQRRRLVFWETYSFDVIQSLALGRPLSTPLNQMDTQKPLDAFATTSPTGEVEESFHHWKYRWCDEVMSVVSDHVLRVKTPSYASALEADRKLRQFTTTYGRRAHEADHWSDPKAAAQFQYMIGTRETSMLYIHRGFFAHAVSTEPVHPERSKYGRSVITAYESACHIVEGMRNFVGSHREFAARIWFLWNHLLSASIEQFVLVSIVTRAPGSSLANPAAIQLDVVHEILKQTDMYGGRTEYMLPLISKLCLKGYNALMEFQAGAPTRAPTTRPEEDDELAVIGGKARIVLSRQTSLSPPQPSQQCKTASALDLSSTTPPSLHAQSQSGPSHSPDALREVYQAQEAYAQPGPPDVYPPYPPQSQEEYWSQSQEGFVHPPMNTPQQTEHVQAPSFVFNDGSEADRPQELAYMHLSHHLPGGQQNHAAAHTLGDGPTLWQTLVRDLSGDHLGGND